MMLPGFRTSVSCVNDPVFRLDVIHYSLLVSFRFLCCFVFLNCIVTETHEIFIRLFWDVSTSMLKTADSIRSTVYCTVYSKRVLDAISINTVV